MPRQDAMRNRETVVEAGMKLLGEDPTASMQEVADRSGLGRSTVYRHFPNREALFGAMTSTPSRTRGGSPRRSSPATSPSRSRCASSAT